jgi:hypothetical protein
MSLLTELDSLASPNYKDASPTGFEKSATVIHEKNFAEESKTQHATKPQTAPFAL